MALMGEPDGEDLGRRLGPIRDAVVEVGGVDLGRSGRRAVLVEVAVVAVIGGGMVAVGLVLSGGLGW